MRLSVIVCAHNEARYLPACLHSLLAQSRPPDDILVINNASTDETVGVAAQIPGVRVIDEPRKGLVVARETGRLAADGDVRVYVDADCRAPLTWLARIERHFEKDPQLLALGRPDISLADGTIVAETHLAAECHLAAQGLERAAPGDHFIEHGGDRLPMSVGRCEDRVVLPVRAE